jgi:hypothetical protein
MGMKVRAITSSVQLAAPQHRYTAKVDEMVSELLSHADVSNTTNTQGNNVWVPLVTPPPNPDGVSSPSPPATRVWVHASKPQSYRVVAELENTPAVVFDLYADLVSRPDWDDTCESVQVLERLDERTAILHVKLKSTPVPTPNNNSSSNNNNNNNPGSPSSANTPATTSGPSGVVTKQRDMVLLYHVRSLPDGPHLLNVTTSVEHPKAPFNPQTTSRAFSKLVGMLVSPLPMENTIITSNDGTTPPQYYVNRCRFLQVTDDEMPSVSNGNGTGEGGVPTIPTPSRHMLTMMASKALPLSMKRLNKVVSSIPASLVNVVGPLNTVSPEGGVKEGLLVGGYMEEGRGVGELMASRCVTGQGLNVPVRLYKRSREARLER